MSRADIPHAIPVLLAIVASTLLASKLNMEKESCQLLSLEYFKVVQFLPRSDGLLEMLVFQACGNLNRNLSARAETRSFLLCFILLAQPCKRGGKDIGGYWMHCIETWIVFVSKDSRILQFMPYRCPCGLIPLMRIRRNYGGPSMPLEQAQQELASSGGSGRRSEEGGGTALHCSDSSEAKKG